ncbi:MAG: hypothetical protein WD715_15180 [Dongiaceae bacterium]
MSQSLRQSYARARYATSRNLNLFLAKRLGVPRVPAIRISRAVSIGMNPFPYLHRPELARQMGAATGDAIAIDPARACAAIAPDRLREIAPAVKQGMEVFRESERTGALQRYDHGASRKEFLVYATQKRATAQYLDIMRLALARPILDAVSRYLGAVPILSDVSVMVSLPNLSEIGSQLYHLDFADDRQVKLFVCVDDVTDDHGPFTFLPGDESERVVEGLNYDRGRLTIEEVDRFLGPGREVRLTGQPGQGMLVDTSCCLHYGSRQNSKTRIMLLIQYTDIYAPELSPADWPVDTLVRALDLDEIQRLAISL